MKKLLCIILCLSLVVCSHVNAIECYASKDGANMSKVLKYYGAKNYNKAQVYAKKLPKTANESCVKKMSSKMKKAYRKVVASQHTFREPDAKNRYLWDFYLTDIDNDNKADLILYYGSCEADVEIIVYQYKSGKAKKVATCPAGHMAFYAYPNAKGFVILQAHMGTEAIYLATLNGKKLKLKLIGSRNCVDGGLSLRGVLKTHCADGFNIVASDLY